MMNRIARAILVGLAAVAVAAAVLIGAGSEARSRPAAPSDEPGPAQREAMFYQAFPDGRVQCQMCPRRCSILPGQRGFCRNRENRDGTLYSVVYGRPCSLSIEPIEKAPFYHFLPGRERLCVATVGCNLTCKYCQNWQISQKPLEEVSYRETSPSELVEVADRNDIPIICFTFAEPVTFYEYMYDTAKLARKAGIKTAVVSNGYINPEPLRKLLTVVDAVKIDLKAFTEEFYREVSGGTLQPVLESIKTVHESGRHLELVNLVVPTYNDDPEKVRQMCRWIKDSVGPDVPLHFTRFTPMYKMKHIEMTPVSTLEKLRQIARDVGLHAVYVGNVPGHEYNSTYCPECGERLINRVGFHVVENRIEDGRCPHCGHEIAGVWKVTAPGEQNGEESAGKPSETAARKR